MTWSNISGMAESRSQIAHWSAQGKLLGAEYLIDTRGINGAPDFPTFCMNEAELEAAKIRLKGRMSGIWVLKSTQS